MATRADVELARRLMQAGILDEIRVRDALGTQTGLLEQGRSIPIQRVLVAKGYLPREALEVLEAKDPLPTQPFPGYRLDRAIGEGGSSVVYAGTYVANGTPVAVKVLHDMGALRPAHLERFYEEARLLVEIEHPNVVAGYEVGYARGHHFFSMDLIEGPTLLQMIERGAHLENVTAISITVQVARAIDYLHRLGLLHRDIKPGNVMIDASGRARLIDLGLVRRMQPPPAAGSPPAAEETTTVGTVAYISPEQARGRGDLDVRSDIYSLGVTLYHMVVGEVPFQGETDYEVMAKQILAALDSQKVKTRRIAPEINYFITKMMAKEREHRYRDAAEVVADLSRFLPPEGPPPIVLPVSSAPPSAPSAPPGPPRTPRSPAPRSPQTPPVRRRRW